MNFSDISLVLGTGVGIGIGIGIGMGIIIMTSGVIEWGTDTIIIVLCVGQNTDGKEFTEMVFHIEDLFEIKTRDTLNFISLTITLFLEPVNGWSKKC